MASIAYLCTDLLFTSKIRETARSLGHEAALARDGAELVRIAREAALVIVDLRRPDALAALATLGADPVAATVRTVGFVDHERTERMAEAREAGCRVVLAKGKFSSELARLITEAARAHHEAAVAER